jgi:YrbI family 3-deoxy-D-manno-octulosonate 8-phosphate phosphatase
MNIKLVVFDFDGVFTEGKIFFNSNNNIIKHYNVKDGTGINNLRKNGIKIWVLSGYKYNESQENICKHLKIDYYGFGIHNKLEILTEKLKTENILFENVAYMGDDINDIDCLQKVYLSGCPKNAHKDCKEVSSFISNYNGGEGCIREFADYILNKKSQNENIISQIRKESNYQLNNFNLEEIKEISDLIINCTGNLYFLGVGKSLNIAEHTCSILKSLNIKCFILNTLNSIHGDIGTINSNDIVFCYSKSGNTKEILNILPAIINKKCKIIGICCNNESKFKDICDKTYILPFQSELRNKKDINCIPSNSFMTFMYFTNILSQTIINESNIELVTYKYNHPAGNIGDNLKQIKDCIKTEYPKFIFLENGNNDVEIELHKILLEMTNYKIGCSFFVNENNELLGIMTDGDIRRLLLKTPDVKKITLNDINKNFIYETNQNKIINELRNNITTIIPILEEKKMLGYIFIF